MEDLIDAIANNALDYECHNYYNVYFGEPQQANIVKCNESITVLEAFTDRIQLPGYIYFYIKYTDDHPLEISVYTLDQLIDKVRKQAEKINSTLEQLNILNSIKE